MKQIFLFTILIVWVSVSFSQTHTMSLGILAPFWRNHPVLGPFLQEGIWLNKVPDYFFDTDFPYKKRPYEKEVMFADHLSVVRLLGGTDNFPGLKLNLDKGDGVNADGTMKKSKLLASDTASIRKLSQYDFAYRKSNGTLGFRPELIKARLNPYVNIGYTSLILVLDNVPWGLRKKPIIGGFGQVGPADNPEEWYQTVKKLCETLKDIFGEKKANQLRFRIGTEMNGQERFAGTEDQFITHFDYAAAAIADVLPGARLGLYNISSASIKNINTKHNVNAFHAIGHSSSGINRKSGNPNVALPFIAASRYYCEKDDLNTIVSGIDGVWNFIKDSIPGNKNFTHEIHEYGAIGDWGANPKTDNPDAFGNAMNLQMMINLFSNGINRLFHWNMLDSVPFSDRQPLMIPNSQLWGYSVLEYMAGGEAYKIIPEDSSVGDKTTHTALLSVFDNKAYLLVSAFNANRNSHNKYLVTLRLPKKNIPFQINKMESATINNSNSIYYNIRQDLEKIEILNPILANLPEYISNLKNMTNDYDKSCLMVRQNWAKYKLLWKESLTLKEFKVKKVDDGDYYKISVELTAPESTVIIIG